MMVDDVVVLDGRVGRVKKKTFWPIVVRFRFPGPGSVGDTDREMGGRFALAIDVDLSPSAGKLIMMMHCIHIIRGTKRDGMFVGTVGSCPRSREKSRSRSKQASKQSRMGTYLSAVE